MKHRLDMKGLYMEGHRLDTEGDVEEHLGPVSHMKCHLGPQALGHYSYLSGHTVDYYLAVAQPW